MCFSATASFISAGVLIGSSAAVSKTAVTKEDKQLALFPLIFGIQQLAEGLVWLALQKQITDAVLNPAVYIFIIIAWSGWPLLVPILYRQHIRNRRMTFMNNMLLTIGALVAGINLWTLYSIPLQAGIDGYHITYKLTSERMLPLMSGILYVLSVLVPPFLTRNRAISISGAVHVAVFVLSYLLMKEFLVSVWCFMAAISSALIWWVVYTHKKKYA